MEFLYFLSEYSTSSALAITLLIFLCFVRKSFLKRAQNQKIVEPKERFLEKGNVSLSAGVGNHSTFKETILEVPDSQTVTDTHKESKPPCGCHNVIWDCFEKLNIVEECIYIPAKPIEYSKPKSLLIYGGTIRPLVDGQPTVVEALGIHGGKVIATGSVEKVKNCMKNIRYETVALAKEYALFPGFIDPHVHIVPTAALYGFIDLSPFEGSRLRPFYDISWLRSRIKEESSHVGFNEWMLGKGLDPSLMPFNAKTEKQGLNKLIAFTPSFLDTVVSSVPFLSLSASMHTAYVNSAALRKIYSSSQSIRNKYKDFDSFRKHVEDAEGLQEISGILPAISCIPKIQLFKLLAGLLKNISKELDAAAQCGITGLYDAALNPLMTKLLKLALHMYGRKVKVGGARVCMSLSDAKKLPRRGPSSQNYKDLYQGHVKLVSDGSNQGLTGFQQRPYCCEPANNIGNFNFGDNGDQHPVRLPVQFKEIFKIVSAKGHDLMVHANGSQAVEFTIEAYESILLDASEPHRNSHRHRMEHCSLLSETQLNRMAAMGLSPSFLIGHVGFWGYVFDKAILEERARHHLDLCGSALKHGLKITAHSDSCVSPLGPLRMVEQLVTRRMEASPSDEILNQNECLTVEQAIRAVTKDAAWQCKSDNWSGDLAVGKCADFVVLANDPHTLKDFSSLRDIPVLLTVCDGQITHGNLRVRKCDQQSQYLLHHVVAS